MRWSEIAARELIDVSTGKRLGTLGEADLLIDEQAGQITTLLVEASVRWRTGARRPLGIRIAWGAIRAIGPDACIVDTTEKAFDPSPLERPE